MRNLRRFVACAAVALAAPAFANTFTMHVFNFDFSMNPAGQPIMDPTIDIGDTIHWVWDSGVHSVTSVDGIPEIFDSGVHTPAFSFDHTFTNAGDWDYFCTIHGFDNGDGTAGGMSGTIHVVPEPASLLMLAGVAALALRRR